MILPATLAVLLLAAAVWIWYRSAHGLIATRKTRKVIVTLKSGEAFDGLLYAVDGDALVLREATALAFGRQAEHVTVNGEALILRADVAYMQFP